ncbi:hypothetical protein BGZ58_002162 [Dissophora ornata]|nr:hypothetical protein BGZ58_002162 [Dissophora ornata]
MKAQMWQTTFEVNTSTPTSTSTSASASSSTSAFASASTSKGPIVGGIVGGLFVLGLIAGALVYSGRRSNMNKDYTVAEGKGKPSGDMRNTSGVPIRAPQVYSSDQGGPQIWSQRLERNPQEGYQMGFQDPL